MDKDFKCYDVGTAKIHLTDKPLTMAKPIKLYHKVDGDSYDKPSFCILLDTMAEDNSLIRYVAGEISLTMLNDGLKTIGYEIIKRGSVR